MKESGSKTERIEIDLAKPVAEQAALAWPSKDGRLSELHAIQSPRTVALRLPDGQVFDSSSQLTTLDQRDGRLVSVILQPPATPLEADACIAQIRELLASNAVLDSESSEVLDGWSKRASPTDMQFAPPLSTRVVAGGASILVTMRLYPGKGWFYTLDFEPRGE